MNTGTQTLTNLTISFFDDPLAGRPYGRCVITDGGGNCKLSRVDNINTILNSDYHTTKTQKLYAMKEVLKRCNMLVHINTPYRSQALFIQKNFEVYEIAKIPVGYDMGDDTDEYQYHIFLRNIENHRSSAYLRPVEKIVEI